VYLIKLVCRFPIKNIFVEGNSYLTDQEIIDLAKIQDYPSIFKYSSKKIERNVKKSVFIKKVKVTKKHLKEVYIKVEENNILFYNSTNKKTVLNNGKEVDKEYNGPILINYVPDKVYKKLIEQMRLVKIDIINRISEIKYDPSNVDEERFLLTMNDGNFVYITLEKLENINNYVKISLEIINKFGHKNGILNLDAGEYFEIFNEE
jgi:cell division protein FtsQ